MKLSVIAVEIPQVVLTFLIRQLDGGGIFTSNIIHQLAYITSHEFSTFTHDLYQCTLSLCRCSLDPSFPTTMQTLRIQTAFWLGLRWSVGGTTSCPSMGSWESNILLCSWYTSVFTTPHHDGPLQQSCFHDWRLWGLRLRGHTVAS